MAMNGIRQDLWYFDEEFKAANSPQGAAGLAFLRSDAFLAIQLRLRSDDSRTAIIRLSPEVCSIPTRKEFVEWLDSFRPFTKEKAADPSYLGGLADLDNQLSKIRQQNEKDRHTLRRQHDTNVKVPRWSVGGLPGFKYPEKIHPRLMKIEAPSSTDIKPLPEELVKPGGPTLGEAMRQDTAASFNFNIPSKLMGAPQNFDTLSATGFSPKRGWNCLDIENFRFPSFKFPQISFAFKVKLPDFPNLPNFNINVPNLISLPPCVAQHIPPMLMPKLEIPSISLGGGEEFALFKNGKKVMDNFGQGFNPLFRGISDAGIKAQKALAGAQDAINGAVGKLNQAANQMAAQANALSQQAQNAVNDNLTKLTGGNFSIPVPNTIHQKAQQAMSKLQGAATDWNKRVNQFSNQQIFNMDSSRFTGNLFKKEQLGAMSKFVSPIPAIPSVKVSAALSASQGGSFSVQTQYAPPYIPKGVSIPKPQEIVGEVRNAISQYVPQKANPLSTDSESSSAT